MKKIYILLGIVFLGCYAFPQNYYLTVTKKGHSFAGDRVITPNLSLGSNSRNSTEVKINKETGGRSGLCTENLYEGGCVNGDGLTYWGLQNVTVSEIPCSGDPEWYHDYTGLNHSLQAGEDYILTVQAGTYDTNFDVWIDFNDDLQLTDEELVLDDAYIGSPGEDYAFDITIPENAVGGSHIMRARTNTENVVSGPCESYDVGNCCDFTAIIEVSAQCDPPSGVGLKMDLGNIPPYAGLEWDVDETGLIDHYKAFLDGEEVLDLYSTSGYWEYGNCRFLPGASTLSQAMELNVFHDAGIVAVDTNGFVSDTVNIHFFFSETAYTRPTGVHIENDLEAGTALLTWDEHGYYAGGEEEPTVTGYSIYLDGNYAGYTEEFQFTYTSLQTGNNYIAGIVTHYSDGYTDSTFFPNYSKLEFYFDELTTPVNLAVDESTGIFTWSKPNNDGDVIGGTFFDYPVAFWLDVWFNPDELWTTFGNETQFVNTQWTYEEYTHNLPGHDDKEAIWFSLGVSQLANFNYADAGDDIIRISEIGDASGLEWSEESLSVCDADTHDGIGTFVAHYNDDNGYYGVMRLDDIDGMYYNEYGDFYVLADFTWWLQTNGSDDFSSAYNYYPNYYLIYLDGELVDTVQPGYEEQYDNNYQYQFEGLVDGQSYTAGIVAVYYVGKSEMVTIEFSPIVGIEENRKASPSLIIYPNPVASQASITYAVYEAGSVTIEIFDVMGKKLKTLLNKNVPAGEYNISWDGKNDKGFKLLPGMYLCTLKTAHHTSTQRILVK
jgi:hypothetical protein